MSGSIQRATSIVDGLIQSIGVAGVAPGQRASSELLCKRGHRWCTLFSQPRAQLSTCLMLFLFKKLLFSILQLQHPCGSCTDLQDRSGAHST